MWPGSRDRREQPGLGHESVVGPGLLMMPGRLLPRILAPLPMISLGEPESTRPVRAGIWPFPALFLGNRQWAGLVGAGEFAGRPASGLGRDSETAAWRRAAEKPSRLILGRPQICSARSTPLGAGPHTHFPAAQSPRAPSQNSSAALLLKSLQQPSTLGSSMSQAGMDTLRPCTHHPDPFVTRPHLPLPPLPPPCSVHI